MRGPPVVLTNTLGRPVTNIISERGAVPMTVVNTLGEPVTLVNSGGEPVTLFNPNGTLWDYPFSLFANNEQGAWYDPSDFSTLYQTSTGTTPVTAVEQPVGLMLDRSRGLVLGPELVNLASLPSPTISNSGGSVGVWDAATRTMSNTGSAASDHPRFTFALGLVVGRTYFVTGVLSGSLTQLNTSAGIRLAASGSANTVPYNSATGVFSGYVVAAATNLQIVTELDGAESLTISSLSVRELPGNHALQATSASRPVLRARYNLLTYSEQFDDGAWLKQNGGTSIAPVVTANAGLAPNGTMTADQVTFNLNGGTSGSDLSVLNQQILSTITLAASFWVRASSNVRIAARASTTWRAIDVTTTWQQIILPSDTGAGLQIGLRGGVVSGLPDTATVELWGAQLLTAADEAATGGAYQRIAAATDYDVSNPVWRPYLAFDGTDDSFGTSAIDFSGTDEMTVFAGLKQQSPNTNSGEIIELSADVGSNNGTFGMAWPQSTDINTLRFQVRGTTFVGVNDATATTQTNTVISLQADISAPSIVGRRNGTQVATSASSLGTGNFGNYPLFIGRRNNASLPFNGRLYSLAVLGRTATAAEITSMEAWVAGKTGVTI